MAESISYVKEVCTALGNDRTRLLDMLHPIQDAEGCISSAAVAELADCLDCSEKEIESVCSFYPAFSSVSPATYTICLSSSLASVWAGAGAVYEQLAQSTGAQVGQASKDGLFAIERSSNLGLDDVEPAALINGMPFTRLSAGKVSDLVQSLRDGTDPATICKPVPSCIQRRGAVSLEPLRPGRAIENAVGMTPMEVIREIKVSRLRGRCVEGFPTGMSWEFARLADGDRKVVICDANESDPSSFRTRVLLVEQADTVIEGLTIAAYAVGADTGILFLKAEYAWLQASLEETLARRRRAGLLGSEIAGCRDFNFDIRIQLGGGAPTCREETALIKACAGQRAEAHARPPFPTEQGYLDRPTATNNPETLCCAAHIIERGAGWFSGMGLPDSTGTQLLCVLGDCERPGLYEVPFGTVLQDVLQEAGAHDARVVQLGGPSGRLIAKGEFKRILAHEELYTSGPLFVLGSGRRILESTLQLTRFAAEGSCGFCVPCRAGGRLLVHQLEGLLEERGRPGDLDDLLVLAETLRDTSLCSIGRDVAQPVLNTLTHFRSAYESLISKQPKGKPPLFTVSQMLDEAVTAQEEPA